MGIDAAKDMKALFLVVNLGFAHDAADFARAEGAKGVTIVNARGVGAHPVSIMGIQVDSAKEMLMSVVDAKTAEKIAAAVKEKMGMESPFNGFCFILPIEKMVGIIRGEGTS